MSDTQSVKSEKKPEHITSIISVDGVERQIKEKDLDLAFQYKDDIENLVIDEAVERRLVRKIDFCLIPMIGLLMCMQLLDKTTNSYASIMGLREDLNFSGSLYSWVGSIFYFGYLSSQFLMNRLLQRFPISKTLGIIVVVWGVILCCHAACYSTATFLVCRFLLGALESAMNPAYVLLTSMWYVRKSEDEIVGHNDKRKNKINQQFIRTTIWFGVQGGGTIIGASMASALYENTYAIPSWRLLYIITGVITIFLGFVSMVHIPDVPVKAWFLNETEKKYVVARSKANEQGFGNTKLKSYQVKEACYDVKSYIFFVYGISYGIANGSFTNFGSILYNEDLKFGTKQALLMNMPGGAIDILCPLVAYGIAYFIPHRLLICAIINSLGIVGMAMLAFTEPVGTRLFGIYTFYLATIVIAGVLSYISSNVAGSTKKIVVHWFFAIGYSAGNIVGPQTFRAEQAPNYIGAKIAMLVGFVVGTICVLTVYYLDLIENRRRDKLREELGEDYAHLPDDYQFADLTDKENLEFRYCA